LETIQAFKLACVGIRSCINEVTLGGFLGSTGRVDFGIFGTGSGILEGVSTMEVSQQRVSSWICAAMVTEKDAAQIPSQLRDCSG